MSTTPSPRAYLRTPPFEPAIATATATATDPVIDVGSSTRASLFVTPMPGSNAWAVRSGAIPCETNPHSGELSRMREPFHAQAISTVGAEGTEQRHVCAWCRQHHHRFNKVAAGVVWGKVKGKSAIVIAATEGEVSLESIEEKESRAE